MLYRRDLEDTFPRLTGFPVIAILGPRQSGKTTISKAYYKNHRFISFEDPEIRELAQADPKRLLKQYHNEHGIIIDEFQYVPEFLSSIKFDVDTYNRRGYYVLTGSINYLMNQAITQSLAGRVGILTLLPFSIHELQQNNLISDINTQIYKGSYPRIYQENLSPIDVYPVYLQTYTEKDVRQISNVADLHTFQKFLGLCAARVGQLLNITDIAMNCGISVPTATRWLSILESSYIIFLLQPHFNNFNKRLTKSPKLYFYDTGVACNLLRITSPDMLGLNPYRGHLFENFIIADLYKQFFNKGQRPPLYFWRDQNGRIEVDCIVDMGLKLIPIEIKSSETIISSFFDNLKAWNEISHTSPDDNFVIYAGENMQERSAGTIYNWQKAATLVEQLNLKIKA